MRKLEDYKDQKIAIHFPTYELWLRRKEINPSDTCKDSFWECNKHKTGYSLYYSGKSGGFSNIEFYKREGFTILPATDFLEEEFIYGQEYEFSDDENFEFKTTKQFIEKTPCGKFIAYDKETQSAVSWKHARKINTERTEAITTIKELVSKFSINQNEVF